jgi:hypothetical protein
LDAVKRNRSFVNFQVEFAQLLPSRAGSETNCQERVTMATPRTSPRSVRSRGAAKPKASAAKAKSKVKSKAPKAKASPKVAAKAKSKAAPKKTTPKTSTPKTDAKAKLADVAGQAKKAIGPEVERLKKASLKVEARLKAVSNEVAKKLSAFEDIAEEQLKSEKNKARLNKLEKDVNRLISSADQQFGKVRGALDEELKDLKALLDKSAEKVIPAAKEKLSSLMPDHDGEGDTWEFYTDKSGKWRWRLMDAAGKSVGASNKAFKDRAACAANARRLGYKGS